MSSFDNSDDDKMNDLSARLSNIKNPSGQPPASYNDLQARFEALRGPKTELNLSSLNSRFLDLKGGNNENNNDNSNNNVPPTQEQCLDIDEDDIDEDGDEDDDFMNFINDNLSSYQQVGKSSDNSTVHNNTFNHDEAKLQAAERRAESIMGSLQGGNNISNMESVLLSSDASNLFLDSSVTNIEGSCISIPEKDKSELDILLEQTHDESRLLRNPVLATYAGPSDNLNENDQISQLILAAKDAAYLDRKYGPVTSGQSTQMGRKEQEMNGLTRNIKDEGECDDRSVSERSYGSMISDDTVYSDSD